MKKKIKYLFFGIVICLLFIWIGSLIKCEVLTHKYYNEFKDAYKENTMIDEIEYFKVLSYSPHRSYDIAQVYYVSKGKTSANVLTF